MPFSLIFTVDGEKSMMTLVLDIDYLDAAYPAYDN
jgi:hypothetical protein